MGRFGTITRAERRCLSRRRITPPQLLTITAARVDWPSPDGHNQRYPRVAKLPIDEAEMYPQQGVGLFIGLIALAYALEGCSE